MTTAKRIILGDSTEAIIRLLFDNRIAQESNESSLNLMSRTQDIRELKTQVMSFVKRNPNSKFDMNVPEFSVGKMLRLSFTNYPELDCDEDEEVSKFVISLDASFTKCTISQKAEMGKDIVVLTLTATK